MSRSGKLVVKDNALIEASYNLSLIEQRLILLAIVEAREITELNNNTPIEITASLYQEQFNLNESNSYKQLSDASKQLFNRQFSYLDRYKSNDVITVARWINRASYMNSQGTVILYLSDETISLISRLEEQFTKYFLIQVSELKSQYSIRLYEIIIKNINLKSKSYSIEDIRNLLGIDESLYKSISYLKRDVIDKAIKEINLKTDITINYKQIKAGKAVTHLSFSFKRKAKEVKKAVKEDQNTIDMFTGMTTKQIDMFADRLSKDKDFQGHYLANEGESMEAYVNRIAEKLADPFYVKEWESYLSNVGFKIYLP